MTESTWNEATEGNAANGDEWANEVEAETPIGFEREGDGFTATYLGMDEPNARGIVQTHFSSLITLNGENVGDALLTSTGKDLQRKLEKVPVKRQVRIEWISSLDTGESSPMRVHKVQWR